MMRLGGVLFFILMSIGCSEKDQSRQASLFSNVAIESGVRFTNSLTITEEFNPYTYRNFYNGGGVAIGDINNDGLADIYLTGNQVDNRLYLNKGNFMFEDITASAGVSCPGVWSSGVTFVDINADGYLDIYVCKSGSPDAPIRHNELFINNGDLTFSEQSKEYGLDITGLSVQAAFFDYDKDGDLDCYILTNSVRSVGNYDLVKDRRMIRDPQGGGNKLLLNENGRFVDHSTQSGIYQSDIGFGLGITLGDYNHDTWTDIFVSNDFFERDYLYINNKDGTFTEALTNYFGSISMGSMGADFADLDNDGIPELFVTEMLPDSLTRRKTKMIFESWDKQQLNISSGYHHQYPRNVLQKKISPDHYAEIGRFAGVAATEWSWGALMFDMDNDGLRDIFVANGIYKDLLDRDYLAYTGSDENIRRMLSTEKDVILRLIELMPTSRFSNYAFRNLGDVRFKNAALDWGLSEPMFSSGSAYGDLDNDGDLDLVVNNINGPAAVYRNNSDPSVNNSIRIKVKGVKQNSYAVGTTAEAYSANSIILADNFVTRGFQSSVDPVIHLNIGPGHASIDSIRVSWPDGADTVLYHVTTGSEIFLQQTSTSAGIRRYPVNIPDLQPFKSIKTHHKYVANGLIDFDRDRLLPMMFSNEAPSLFVLNDGSRDIVYIGGGKNQGSSFGYLENGSLELKEAASWKHYALSEESKSVFFDADGDGDLDFYMANGGRYFSSSSSALNDHLFINDGQMNFVESKEALPLETPISTGIVVPIDFDRDGDLDLVVGERYHPFVYGHSRGGILLENNGQGVFTDKTASNGPVLKTLGMITDAKKVDYNNDGWEDLVVVGDWSPIVFLRNEKGTFHHDEAIVSAGQTKGWWRVVEAADLNDDGRPDFIFGNFGTNTFFRPGDKMYVGDVDKNGSVEQFFCTKVGERYYPVADRDELISQVPSLKKRLLFYRDYARLSIDEILGVNILQQAKEYQVDLFESVMLLSNDSGYGLVDLPPQAQFAPIFAIKVLDVDGDGVLDVIAAGNQFQVKPQFGSYDASKGWLFRGQNREGQFSLLPGISLGIDGQVRDIEVIEKDGKKNLIFLKYDDKTEILEIAN